VQEPKEEPNAWENAGPTAGRCAHRVVKFEALHSGGRVPLMPLLLRSLHNNDHRQAAVIGAVAAAGCPLVAHPSCNQRPRTAASHG
jgi:hypothetical protein